MLFGPAVGMETGQDQQQRPVNSVVGHCRVDQPKISNQQDHRQVHKKNEVLHRCRQGRKGQNFTTRIISGKRKFDHITPALRDFR